MDPLSKLELFFAKWGVIIVAIILVFLIIVGWLGYNSWRNSQNGKAIINSVKVIGAARVESGQGAVNTLDKNQQKDAATDAKLAPIIQNFNTYPAAKVGIDPAFLAAFDRSLCVYRSAANLLQCRGMQQVAPGAVEN